MRRSSVIIILAVLLVQTNAAPQFITFKEGKLGVNFGGYHAGVGLGGLLGGNGGAGGGLFAEAGTPYGQSAKAGLGGNVDANGGSSGGLYAGATAGGNVRAAAGLGGAVTGEKSVGGGFAMAQSGSHYASSDLGGGSSVAGSSGLSISAHKSIGVPTTVVKETKYVGVPSKEVECESCGVHKNVYSGVKLDATNEINPVAHVEANVESNVKPTQSVVVKEVYVEQPQVIEKTIIRSRKPHRHHFRKTAYIGGYVNGGSDVVAAVPTVVKTVQPVQIERRADVNSGDEFHAGAGANVNANAGGGGGVTYTKKVSVASNPTFFQDIFNIPISTLKAVNSFLTNAAAGTSVSVQKSASLQAGGYSGFK